MTHFGVTDQLFPNKLYLHWWIDIHNQELWYIYRLCPTSDHICICTSNRNNSREETRCLIRTCMKQIPGPCEKGLFDLENLCQKCFKVWHFLMHNKQLDVSLEYQCSTLSFNIWDVYLTGIHNLPYWILNFAFAQFGLLHWKFQCKIHLSIWAKSIDLFADKSSWKCLPELPLWMEFGVCFCFIWTTIHITDGTMVEQVMTKRKDAAFSNSHRLDQWYLIIT